MVVVNVGRPCFAVSFKLLNSRCMSLVSMRLVIAFLMITSQSLGWAGSL